MSFLNKKYHLGFFVYLGQLLSRLSLIVGFFKNFGIVIVFSWLFQQLKPEGGQSSQHSNIFAGLRWPTVESPSFLAYFIQYRRQT